MTKRRINAVVTICFIIAILTATIFGMYNAYKVGIDQGREEAVQMITDFTDDYTFTEVTSKENGGTMGYFGHTDWFPSGHTLLDCQCDWDGNLNISLKKMN